MTRIAHDAGVSTTGEITTGEVVRGTSEVVRGRRGRTVMARTGVAP